MDVRLWRRPATLRSAVVASTRRHDALDRIFLELTHDGVTGFGEVSPLGRGLSPDPGVDEVVAHAIDVMVPRLIDFVSRDGALPEWTRVHLWTGGSNASSWTAGLVEMALLDWSLVRDGESLATAWSVPARDPTVMATTSLIDPDSTWSPPPSVARVRAKVGLTTDPALAAIVARTWRRPVVWDFNASATDADAVLAWSRAASDGVDVVAIEQPFASGDIATHALLAREIDVPLSLDESVTSPARVRLIARHGAASMVCVKPPRVGGLAAARATIAEARACGLRAYVGGFFESPLARRTHAAVAVCTGADPSDVAAVDASGDAGDRSRDVGLGTVPDLTDATLLQSWEIT